MKIIKPGDMKRLNKILKFKCDKCGCIFEAEKGEYKIVDQYILCEYYYCKCPTCGNTVYKGEI